MIWRGTLLILVGCLLSFFRSTPAQADPQLVWAIPPFPPAFIERHGQISGYGIEVQNWFSGRLSGYRQKNARVPLARLLAEMRGPQLRCSSVLLETPERRKYIYFSQPVLMHLPLSVVIRTADISLFRPMINARGEINLDLLLANRSLESAVRIGRSYGATIDQALDRAGKNTNIMRIGADDKLIRLLALKRLDWVFAFPSEAEYQRRQARLDISLESIPIAGNPPILRGTFGCSKTPEGKKVIDQVNRIIDANPDRPWQSLYADWLSPQDKSRYNRKLSLLRPGRSLQPPS
jgi:uncharacterized protein (TIGR02285 family)